MRCLKVSDLSNPLRFSIRNRSLDIEKHLRHPNFVNKHVTEIDVRPSEGNLYVHWEEDDIGPGHPLSGREEDDG